LALLRKQLLLSAHAFAHGQRMQLMNEGELKSGLARAW
jgi:hypothetical protein